MAVSIVEDVPNRSGGRLEPAELGAADAGIEATAFKQAMRHLAAAVVMVTTRVDGRPCGLTISFDDPQRLWPWIEDQAEARRYAAATAGRLWRALSTRAHARSALGLASRRLVQAEVGRRHREEDRDRGSGPGGPTRGARA